MILPRNCYYHGIDSKFVKYNNLKEKRELVFNIFQNILDDQAIIAPYLQDTFVGYDYYNPYNSEKQICVCKDMHNTTWEKDHQEKHPSAFKEFVRPNLSIIIDENIDVTTPILFPTSYDMPTVIKKHGLTTDMYDEYRVNGYILSSDFIGIGIPFFYNYIAYISKSKRYSNWVEVYKEFYNQIVEELVKHNLNLPIYDIDLQHRVTDVDSAFIDEINEKSLLIKK